MKNPFKLVITTLKGWLPSRERREPVTTVVLHATDGASAGSSISWLRKIRLSYHAVIERDGTITKCVPFGRVALHAGKSVGPTGPNVNRYSIGIAFANYESQGEQITDAQVAACKGLVAELHKQFPDLKWLTCHYSISPGRRTDPKWLHPLDITDIAAIGRLVKWRTKPS